jgi:sulfur relay (sulfurtransferase) complex TusBCD TusD component (DsrE family)
MFQLIVLNSDGSDYAEPELGKVIVHNFLQACIGKISVSCKIVLYNTGVFNASIHSIIIENLQIAVSKGAEVYICKTCATFYNQIDLLQVGELCTMPQIVDWMAEANNTIRL